MKIKKPEKWLKHANPWSLITRFLILAVWSRVWLGWYSLIPIILLIIWTLVNPVIFPIGTIFIYLAKMWFLNRMVWVYMEMKHHPEYRQIWREVFT